MNALIGILIGKYERWIIMIINHRVSGYIFEKNGLCLVV